MQNQTTQPNLISDEHRTISGQLTEWGIDFNQDRVAQLTKEQCCVLQKWINAGVDADETYQEVFESLPEFMENELLEMSGKFSTEPQEKIIEQAINAYETESPIMSNPYLFDTKSWILWRKAYCRWHRGETLELSEEIHSCSPLTEDQQSIMELNQQLIDLSPRLIQTKHSLKKLRSKLKKTKRRRNAIRNQQTQLLYELSDSFASTKKAKGIALPASEKVQPKNTDSVKDILIKKKEIEVEQTHGTPTTDRQIQIVRIPVTGPSTNRVEVYLQQDQEGYWLAGHLWSIVADARTVQISRGSKLPDQKQTSYSTESEALMNEVLNLSEGTIGVIEVENQIIDYLNLLEEYPGQIAVCSTCQRHYINNEIDESDFCSKCTAESDA